MVIYPSTPVTVETFKDPLIDQSINTKPSISNPKNKRFNTIDTYPPVLKTVEHRSEFLGS